MSHGQWTWTDGNLVHTDTQARIVNDDNMCHRERERFSYPPRPPAASLLQASFQHKRPREKPEKITIFIYFVIVFLWLVCVCGVCLGSCRKSFHTTWLVSLAKANRHIQCAARSVFFFFCSPLHAVMYIIASRRNIKLYWKQINKIKRRKLLRATQVMLSSLQRWWIN